MIYLELSIQNFLFLQLGKTKMEVLCLKITSIFWPQRFLSQFSSLWTVLSYNCQQPKHYVRPFCPASMPAFSFCGALRCLWSSSAQAQWRAQAVSLGLINRSPLQACLVKHLQPFYLLLFKLETWVQPFLPISSEKTVVVGIVTTCFHISSLLWLTYTEKSSVLFAYRFINFSLIFNFFFNFFNFFFYVSGKSHS